MSSAKWVLRPRNIIRMAALAIALVALAWNSGQTTVLAAPNTTAYAVTTSGMLITFEVTTPGTITPVGAVTGLGTGESIKGIDFRPETGELFAIAVNGTAARLYTLNRTTAAATAVGAGFQITPAAAYGFDFNPTVDLIRFVTSGGDNLRLNPDDGTIAGTDQDLNFGMGDVNQGDTPDVSAAAYTNNFNGAKATVLYVLEAGNDVLAVVNPPNNGTMNTRGNLGINLGAATDTQFDISTEGLGYVAATVGGQMNFYTINLLTGATTLVGPVGTGTDTQLVGLSIELGMSPVMDTTDVFGVTDTGNLVTFERATPQDVITIGAITGLGTGEAIVGIDTRPETGQLFAVAVNGTMARLYAIDKMTAAATAVGTGFAITPAADYGFDFNPTVDLIRFVTSNNDNYRLNPDDGTLAGTDGDLAFAMGDPNFGDTPLVASAAYTNNFNGAKATILYVLEAGNDVLAFVNPPGMGSMNTVAPLNIALPAEAEFDIDVDGTAVVAANVGGALNFYTLNLLTGATTLVNTVGSGTDTNLVAMTLGAGVEFPPAGAFKLASPANNAFIRDLAGTTSATWTPAAGATQYNFVLYQISDNVRLGEAANIVINAAEICDATVCTLPLDFTLLANGFYSWTVIASAPGSEVEAGNGPFFFTIKGDAFELVVNGSFETAGSKPNLAQRWVAVNPSGERRDCREAQVPQTGLDGTCAYLNTAGQTPAALTQKVNTNLATRLKIGPGDSITVNALLAAGAAPAKGSVIRVELLFAGGKKQIRNVPLALAAYDATAFQAITPVTFDVQTNKGVVRNINIQVRNANTTGRFYVDAVSVTLDPVTPPAPVQAAPVALPEAPAELRGQ